ncbi:MAG: aminotransferase class V-fold PLP-dependent enzyme, partial [Bacillus sp. (in: firmicutes)]
GMGGVYVDPRIKWQSFFPGTSHEKGFRPGTVNVTAIAAMTVAAQKITGSLQADHNKYRLLRKAFMDTLEPIREQVKIYQGDEGSQLASIIGLRISGIEGQWMMLECNRLGFAISTGSACQIGMQSPAKVTQALGLTTAEAKEFIRISFGHSTSLEDVIQLGESIVKIVNSFKATSVI